MTSFEWLELHNLSQEIVGLESRLRAVSKAGNQGLLKLLKHRLRESDKSHIKLLGLIAKHMASPSTTRVPHLQSAYRIG